MEECSVVEQKMVWLGVHPTHITIVPDQTEPFDLNYEWCRVPYVFAEEMRRHVQWLEEQAYYTEDDL